MEDITKKPLVEIITEMSKLDKEIDLKLLQYEKLRLEVVRRFPFVEQDKAFKPKQKKI